MEGRLVFSSTNLSRFYNTFTTTYIYKCHLVPLLGLLPFINAPFALAFFFGSAAIAYQCITTGIMRKVRVREARREEERKRRGGRKGRKEYIRSSFH